MSEVLFQKRDQENIEWYPCNFRKITQNEIWGKSSVTTQKGLGLYIHIPFCMFMCPFCHFNRYLWSQEQERIYVDALKKEIRLYSFLPLLNKSKITAIYFGGGTPTALTTNTLVDILRYIREKFSISKNAEITVEAHPLTIDRDKLSGLLENGVNRISIGIQSLTEKFLKILGTPHDVQRGVRAIELAKDSGFQNISIDLIYSIPTEGIDDWERDLELALKYETAHIACYPLAVVPRTTLYKNIKKGKLPNKPDEATEIEMFKHARNTLEMHGYEQYTIFNFAKKNKKCLYIRIAQEAPQGEYLGLGAGAFEYVNDFFSCKEPSLEHYVKILKKDIIPYLAGVYMSTEEKMARYMILGIKCLKVSKEEFKKKFGVEIREVYGNVIEELKKWDLVTENTSTISLTEKGMVYISNIAKMFYTNENRGLSQPIEMNLQRCLEEILHNQKYRGVNS